MASVKIEKYTRLPKSKIKAVKALTAKASEFDQTTQPFDWETIENRNSTSFCEFIFYRNNKIIAYLSLYDYHQDFFETSALVSPELRRQGVFTRLLQEALLEIKNSDKKGLLFKLPPNAKIAKQCLAKLKATYQYSELTMAYDDITPPIDDSDVTIRSAHLKDIKKITEIDVQQLEAQ